MENPWISLLKEFLNDEKYILVNATDKVVNGPYTRYDPSDPENEEKKSALDLVIVSRELFKYIGKVEIDKHLKWTPGRPYKNKMKFSDHYAMLVEFLNIPERKDLKKITKKNNPVIWKYIP